MQIGEGIVSSEVFTIEIDDTYAVGWACLRTNVVNNRLQIVLETTLENVPVSPFVCGDREVDISEELRTVFRCGHRAPDLRPSIAGGWIDSAINSAQGLNILSEPLTCDNYVAAETVTGSRSRLYRGNIVEGKSEMVLVVVLPVEGHLEVHLVAFVPTTRRDHSDHRVVEPLNWHNLCAHLS